MKINESLDVLCVLGDLRDVLTNRLKKIIEFLTLIGFIIQAGFIILLPLFNNKRSHFKHQSLNGY